MSDLAMSNSKVDVEGCVKYFMAEAGQLVNTSKESSKDLRLALIDEEFNEFVEALNYGDDVLIAKELGDLIYVVVGTFIAFGYPFNDIFRSICESNFSKFDSEGHAIFREDGKVMKGPNYVAPEPAIREILISEGVRV